MSNFRIISRQLIFYFLASIGGNLVALFSIPILFRTLGGSLWGDLIVAQSIGMLLAILIDLGYSNFAPARISQLDYLERDIFYVESLRHRLGIFSLLIICFASFEIIGLIDFSLSQLIIMLAYASQGLSSSWLLVSRNDAKGYFLKITMPRTILPLLGSVLTIFWSSGLLYALFVLAGSVVSLSFNNRRLFPKRRAKAAEIISDEKGIQGFVKYDFLNSVLANSLLQSPILLVAHYHPTILISFALADKIIKAFSGLTWPVTAIFQGSVFKDIGFSSKRLRKTEILFGLAIAIVSLIVVPTTCNLIVKFLTGETLQFSVTQRVLIGMIIYIMFQNSLMASVHIVRQRKTKLLVIINAISLFFILINMIILNSTLTLTESLLIVTFAFSINFCSMRILIKKSKSLTNPLFP